MVSKMVKNIVFAISVLYSCAAIGQIPGGSWFSESSDPAKPYSFVCVSSSRLASDSCDICPTSIVESRSFNGLLIKRDSVPWKWVDQPYSIRIKPGDIIEYWEHGAHPYAERITIPLSLTPFENLQAMADSTWCNATSPGSYPIWYASDSINTAPIFRSDTVTVVGRGIIGVEFDSLLQKYVISADTTGLGGGGGSSLWTDAGAFTHLTATGDRVLVGGSTEVNTGYVFQSNGGVFAKGTGLTAATNTMKSADSGGTATFSVDDLGQSGFGKSVTLTSGTNFAVISTNATTPGGAASVTITNGSGAPIASTAGFVGGEVIYAGSDAFTVGRGMSFNTLNNNTSTSNDITGVYASARGNTAGSRAAKYTSFLADAYTEQTAGTVTEIIGFNSRFWGVNAAGSTASSVYGSKLDNILNSGTITNTYGYWVGDVTTGTQTNQAYSFISTDANARQGFSGSTQLGGTGVPARTAHVVGEIRVTDLDTDPATDLIGADADGDFDRVTLGSGLSISGGTLSVTGVGDLLQLGNTFGAELIAGTNDNFATSLETNGVTRFTISSGATTGGDITSTGITANTNAVQDRLLIRTNSTAAGTAANFGGSILYQGESTTTDNRDMVRLSAIWTTATDASRASALVFSNVTAAGALTERFRWTATSMTLATNYTFGASASTILIGQSTGLIDIQSQNTTATSIKIGNNNNAAAGSVTLGGYNWNLAAGTKTEFFVGSALAPASGTMSLETFKFNSAINQTGGANGDVSDIYIARTYTSLNGFHYGLRIEANNANARAIYQTGELGRTYFQGKMTIERQTAETGANNAFLNLNGGSITGDVDVLRSSANISSEMRAVFANARNTGNTGNTRLELQVGGVSAGDPYILFAVPSGTNHVIGIDNTDADKLKITPGGTAPGSTANKGVIITTDAVTRVGINKDAPLHDLDVAGVTRALQFRNTGNLYSAANVAFGAGAGTGPVINSISGGNNFMQITFTTGTTPTADGEIFTLTYPNAYGTLSYVVPGPRGDPTGNNFLDEQSKFNISAAPAASFTMKANGTLTASTQYGISFIIGGY